MSTMKLGMKDLGILNAALSDAIEWQESLAEANAHILSERKKCEERVARYKKLRAKVLAAFHLEHKDPLENAKTISIDELRKSSDTATE